MNSGNSPKTDLASIMHEKQITDPILVNASKLISEVGDKGLNQGDLWKKLNVSSRDGSRISLKLEKKGVITRQLFLADGRWTYRLRIKKEKLVLLPNHRVKEFLFMYKNNKVPLSKIRRKFDLTEKEIAKFARQLKLPLRALNNKKLLKN